MTEEQKEAARERLAKAREAKGPAQYKNISPKVIALPDDDTFSYKNVKLWQKEAKSHATSLNKDWKWNKTRGALAKSLTWKGYARDIQYYLEEGDWVSDYYGEKMEHRTAWRCVAMAYYPSGQPKRQLGVYYKDVGKYWSEQDQKWEDEDWGVKDPNMRGNVKNK